MQAAFFSGVVYMGWLSSAAGKDFQPRSQFAIGANLKLTFWLLVLCIPGAFLIIGIIAAPVIIVVSSIRLLIVLVKEQLRENES
jgi:hypothetical protein